jgi:hypothetical protein
MSVTALDASERVVVSIKEKANRFLVSKDDLMTYSYFYMFMKYLK